MILVLLGTNPYSFDRLIGECDEIAMRTNKKVLIQLGNSTLRPVYAESFTFKPHEEIITLIKSAEVIITQGGYGSIYDCLLQKKKIIAVPRLNHLEESCDSGLGQKELVNYLEDKKRLVALKKISDLEEAIERLGDFNPDFDFDSFGLSELVQKVILGTIK